MILGKRAHRGRPHMQRPWEPLHMTTATWMELPAVLLPIAALRPCQDVDPATVWAKMTDWTSSWTADPLPHIVEWADRWWIEDGHHRVMAAIHRGEHHIWARLTIACGEPVA